MSKAKDEMRKRLASLSFAEKIKILGKLRDRSLTLAAGGRKNKMTATQKAGVTTQVSSKETKEG